jgi:Uma2 family endonuclease
MTTVDHAIRVRQWTLREYDRLIETGFFHEDDTVELIGGQLMVAEPQGSRHAATISLVADALRAAFGSGWYVMVQLPIALDDDSEPEPDVAVVRGTARADSRTRSRSGASPNTPAFFATFDARRGRRVAATSFRVRSYFSRMLPS